MAKSFIGATVQFCGHDGTFIADIIEVGTANVVHAAHAPIDGGTIKRPAHNATHHISDFPVAGFWKPRIGVFVVHASQVKELSIADDDGGRTRIGNTPTDEDEDETRYTNYFVHCGVEWTDQWSCQCNDECPKCGGEIEPYASEEDGKIELLGVDETFVPEDRDGNPQWPEGVTSVHGLNAWPDILLEGIR